MTHKHSVPEFDGTNYIRYKKLVKMWAKVTKVEPENQGAELLMHMKGKALDIAIDLDENNPSFDNLINILDAVYEDSNTLLLKYEEFDNIKRDKNQYMKEYVHIFEQKSKELKSEKLEIPEIILAFKLLKSANLSTNDEKLTRATCKDMKFDDVKKALLRISESPSYLNSSNNLVKVKQEMKSEDDITFYAENNNHENTDEILYQTNRRTTNNHYQNNNIKQCYGCGETTHWIKDCPEVNRKSNFSSRQCYGCGETSHWIKDCRYLKDLQALIRSQRSSSQNSRNNSQRNNNQRRTYLVEQENEDNNDANIFYSDNESNQEDKPIFFQSNVGNEIEDILLVGETINRAVLDCGASKTVCGLDWYQCYVDSLDRGTCVKEFSSDSVFKFGVGKLKAEKMVHLPVTVFDQDIILEVHVVDTDIPLLLSLNTMKSMGLNINFETDKAHVGGKVFDLQITSTGHYTLLLSKAQNLKAEHLNEEIAYFVNSADKDYKKIALKLHRRFAHANSARIIKLLKNAGKHDKSLEKELIGLDNTCDFCFKHKRASPRPSVSLPLANEFNELVAIDLKQIDGKWVLHCVDYLTRFSSAHVLKNKESNEIIEKFFMIWISVYGPPQKILSDNGTEFTSSQFSSMCEAFNIAHKTTAAEAPFSNGMCERHNALIGEMTMKIKEDIKCRLQVALMWAVHAKNALINIFGFSPYQLVFGKNPNIPGNSNNKLPAMTPYTSSEIVADHLNSLRRAREEYMKAENSDRVRRALSGRVYSGTHQKFCIGDTVYYKRLGSKSWHGPAKVIAQDGCEVLIKTGARTLIKVHPCKLVLKAVAEQQMNSGINQEEIKVCEKPSIISYESDSSDDEEIILTDKDKNHEIQENGPSEIQQAETSQAETSQKADNVVTEIEVSQIDQKTVDKEDPQEKTIKKSKGKKNKSKGNTKITAPVNTGDKICFIAVNEAGEEKWTVATIVSAGGKATGALKNYWNVKLFDGTQMGVNLDQVDWIKNEDKSGVEVFTNQIVNEVFIQNYDVKQSDEFYQAKESEVDHWKKFEVYEEVERKEYPSEDVLSSRWVTTKKQKEGKTVYKARLVPRGFEEFDAPKADSPTASKSSSRMCIIFCNMFNWELQSLDVRAAFLQSNTIDRIILMKPPKEFRKDGPEIVWKINKPVYGLKDGARGWFLTLKKELLEWGCKPLKLDPSVYTYLYENQLAGFLVIHVDDFMIAGNEQFHINVIDKIVNKFEISSRNSGKFKYVGWDINQHDGYIDIDQISYQNGINAIELNSARLNQTDHELNEHEKKLYQQLLGQLQWISSQTRPDIRFAVLECSLMASKPKICDIVRINKVVKKLKKNTTKITMSLPQCTPKQLKILAFADAALSNLPDKISSTRSFVIFVKCGNKIAPISWCSKKMERVAKTIIYAEGIALGKCLEEAVNLRDSMIEALNCKDDPDMIPIVGITDSKSLWENIHSSSQANDLKLRREIAAMRQQIELKEVKDVIWKPTQLQLADCLTKSTASPQSLLHVLDKGDFVIDL